MSDDNDDLIPLAPLPPPVQPPAPATAAQALAAVRATNHPPVPGMGIPGGDLQAVEHLNRAYRQMTDQLGKIIVGQQEVIEQVLTAMFCRGIFCWWVCRGCQDAADQDDFGGAESVVQTRAVYAGPDAVGHYRDGRAGRGPDHGQAGVSVCERAAVREHAAGR